MTVLPEESAASNSTRFDNDFEPGRTIDPSKREIGDNGKASSVGDADIIKRAPGRPSGDVCLKRSGRDVQNVELLSAGDRDDLNVGIESDCMNAIVVNELENW